MRLAVLALVACSSAQPAPVDPYAAHIAALRKDLAAKGLRAMSIRVEKPFVVVGDAGSARLADDAQIVRWAADKLEADFFHKRPTRILDIYLFHDASSYDAGVEALTGDAPTTPYGFYSSKHGGLYMNIATGGGTLVHEIVHPYVEADFPDAPPWLNEGLGSLFEQSAEKSGHIVGLTNWRLAGLQRAIARGKVPSFDVLTSLSPHAFYDGDTGVNYATSRYLLYFLQEHDKLHAFYRRFRASRTHDPTGYDTLVETLGHPDMEQFEDEWEVYVNGLSFDR